MKNHPHNIIIRLLPVVACLVIVSLSCGIPKPDTAATSVALTVAARETEEMGANPVSPDPNQQITQTEQQQDTTPKTPSLIATTLTPKQVSTTPANQSKPATTQPSSSSKPATTQPAAAKPPTHTPSPTFTKTYTPTPTKSYTPSATQIPQPSIKFFNTDKTALCQSSDEIASLSWDTEHADSVFLDNNQLNFKSQSSYTIAAHNLQTGSNTLLLQVQNSVGFANATVTIEVIPDPNITFFNTDRDFLSPGDIATLSWNGDGATDGKLTLGNTGDVWTSLGGSNSGWTIGHSNLAAGQENKLILEVSNTCGAASTYLLIEAAKGP